ncbi:MAG: choice-of-anchor T family protein, partial [Candidatus Thermoplasmatota archaeon]|nr:choice-of-anchor T family protein [Candidatus Thermoplasmatota archaeon]
FTVLNYGNHVDTILVEVVNQEKLEEAGFIIALSQPQIEIDSQGELQVPLNVRTPRGTALGWFNEYHTIIVKASTTLAGETEARSITSNLWVRGVFVPGFESSFSMLALAIVATALARMKRDNE